jgi:phosphoribosylanthranilate isomerase
MPLSHLFKLNSAEHLSDTRYAAGMGVDFIGFTFSNEDINNDVRVKEVLDIIGWIQGPRIVIEDLGLDLDALVDLQKKISADGLESPSLELLFNSGLIPIWRMDWSKSQNLMALKDRALKKFGAENNLIFHLSIQPSERQDFISDIESIKDWPSTWPIILLIHGEDNEIKTWLNQKGLAGFSMTSGQEERAGFKDLSALADALESLEIE